MFNCSALNERVVLELRIQTVWVGAKDHPVVAVGAQSGECVRGLRKKLGPDCPIGGPITVRAGAFTPLQAWLVLLLQPFPSEA